MISISHYLYRKTRHKAILALIVLSVSAVGSAQIRDRTEHPRVDQDQTQAPSKKPAKRGPRAIGVVEFLPKGGARLVPIALWIDGRYYDASFYGANPAPMALQPETLYEAMNYGEPTGWFTVTTPKQVNGNWVADGKWKTETAFDVMQAHQAAKQAKKKAPSVISDDSGPPVLRRAPSSGSPETESSSGNAGSSSSSSGGTAPASNGSNPPPPSSDDSDRPTLKNSSPPSSTDSSRPTLGGDTSQASAQTPATPPPPASAPDENDPDRPTLHRGKPTAQPSSIATATAAPKTNASKTPRPDAAAQLPKPSTAGDSSQPGRAFPAISDAGIYETRSFFYSMTPADKEQRGRPMLALALDEVRAYHKKRQQAETGPKAQPKAPAKTTTKAPAKTAAQSENFVVTDYDLRAFDLDFSNSPTFVLTAKVPAPSGQTATGGEFDYFVTVVARVDINGQTQKVFSSVTDNNHLDAFPRLEIIDAVDADANGRGDLLFRQHSDSGVNYALYRVYPYQMVKVFEGGGGM